MNLLILTLISNKEAHTAEKEVISSQAVCGIVIGLCWVPSTTILQWFLKYPAMQAVQSFEIIRWYLRLGVLLFFWTKVWYNVQNNFQHTVTVRNVFGVVAFEKESGNLAIWGNHQDSSSVGSENRPPCPSRGRLGVFRLSVNVSGIQVD